MKFLVSLSPKKKNFSKFTIFVLEIPMCVDVDFFFIYDLSTYYFDFCFVILLVLNVC